ncbi:MAG: hypothetical protein VYD19_08555 [Myxococcota bacterium]|nr:hypothetical protein [Myxococcota bacterium]
MHQLRREQRFSRGQRPIASFLMSAGLLFSACDEGENSANSRVEMGRPEAEPPPPSCGEEIFLRDEVGAPSAFPSDRYLVADPESVTGYRIELSSEWIETHPDFVKAIYHSLNGENGWGINGGLVLRADSPLVDFPEGRIEPGDEAKVRLLMLDQPERATDEWVSVEVDDEIFPREVPLESTLFDEGRGLILRPLRPLKPTTRYGLVIQRAYVDEGGPCLLPSPAVAAHLAGFESDPRVSVNEESEARLVEGTQRLLEVSALPSSWVGTTLIFTTQAAQYSSREVAALIREEGASWAGELDCQEALSAGRRRCARIFLSRDFRVDEELPRPKYGAETPYGEELQPIPVSFWLPDEERFPPPWPLILFGHGVGGDVDNALYFAEELKNVGAVIAAIPAQRHVGHPNTLEGSDVVRVLDFFAIDQRGGISLKPLKARDNFRQSTYDKLQLIELLSRTPSLGGDVGALDPSRFAYYGLSLGGIMGVELLALEPRLRSALLTVAGGRLSAVITEGNIIGPFSTLLQNLVGGESEFDALIPIVQSLLDVADPNSYAPFVLQGRLPEVDQGPPHLLFQMAMNDEVVPNSANFALVRALQVPHLTPERGPEPLAPDGLLPARANLNGISAGLFQFDRVLARSGPVPSAHNNVPFASEATLQSAHFFLTWLSDETPEIRDPYEALGIPEL